MRYAAVVVVTAVVGFGVLAAARDFVVLGVLVVYGAGPYFFVCLYRSPWAHGVDVRLVPLLFSCS